MCHLSDDTMDARSEAKKVRDANDRGEFCNTCQKFDDTIAQIKQRWPESGFCFDWAHVMERNSWCKRWEKIVNVS